ncbi:MAG: membrane dipeptidase [Alphaproteobacteria bacterium]|nr:membrane dipeptidase [Alphaproteobacteria bacterium]
MARRNMHIRTLLAGAALLALATSACASPPAPAAANVEGVSAKTMAMHQHLLVLDTHLDTPAQIDTQGFDIMKRHDVKTDGSEVDVPRMNDGGLDGGFFAIYMPQGPLTPEGYASIRDKALLRAVAIHKMIAANPETFELALTPDDARRITAEGKKFVFLSMENSYELGDDLTLLDTFYKLGVRLAGPVHNGNNQLADSNTDPKGAKWNGLSPMGKAWLKRCNELGIIIDGSHSSNQTIEQMIDLSATPIVLSHHGASALFAHSRNSPDDLLKKLAAKGGVIQMNTMFLKAPQQSPERVAAQAALMKSYGDPETLSPEKLAAFRKEYRALSRKYPEKRADFEDYMKAILYVVKLIGPEHVGFGADWDGGGGLEGYEDVSYLPKVSERLLAAGYSEADLANMWGGNVLRVMKETQDYAASLKN